jgi:XTP/dITP diphosphohydrolase
MTMGERGTGTVLLATTNEGKRREFRSLLPSDVDLVGLDAFRLVSPAETGATFRENADLKALHGADRSGLLTLADDSGLAVDALGGAPGVRSARFAGEDATDAENREALLAAMAGVDERRRGARFVCAVSLARPGAVIARAEGALHGRVGRVARGGFGFGYDPLFLLPDGRTMAELAPEEKNRISHRADAYRKILPALLEAVGTVRPSGRRR